MRAKSNFLFSLTIYSQAGSSLVGVLTASGIMAVLVLAFSSMVSDTWMQLSRQTAKFEQLAMVQELRTEFSIPSLCAQGLSASHQRYQTDGQGGMDLAFRFANGVEVGAAASEASGSQLVVDRLRFIPAGTEFELESGGTAYYGDVVMDSHIRGVSDTALKPIIVTKTFLNTDDTGKVVGCFADSNSLGQAGAEMPCGPPPSSCRVSTGWGRSSSSRETASTTYEDGTECAVSGGSTQLTNYGGPNDSNNSTRNEAVSLTCYQVCNGGEWSFSRCSL